VIFFTVIIGVIDGFQYFDQAYIASGAATLGAPNNSLLFYGIWMYEQAFQSFHMGYAAAMAWVLFVAIMLCTAVLLLTSRRWVHYGGGMS
jgi:ABC-type sugar transport system permease subunit